MTAPSLTAPLLVVCLSGLFACGDPATGGAASASAAAPKPTAAASTPKPAATAAATATAAETAADDDIPTEQDFEEAAETEITEATMVSELDAITKEIDDDKE